MEFWGVEVKSGEPLRVESGDGFILHLSQACLGEAKKDKGNESVCIYVNFDDQKLVLGTLSHDKIPQIPFDLVFEKDFELSHNLKNGSVYFSGYKVAQPDTSDSDEFNSDGEEDLPFPVENEAKQPKPEEENPAKPDSKQKVKIVEPSKDGKPKPENDDSSDEEDDSSDDGESSDDQPMMMANDEDEISEDEDDKSDEDDDDSDDGDMKTTKKAEVGKKRSTESASKSPVPDKKAKFVTPQKTDFKKVGVHIATPHPSKQAAKTSANRQKMEQAQKSFSCSSCNRSFGSENALQSHSKAKHSAA
ncbi:hypothetical protein OIU84_010960 [Salix udensis]|uniref:C2H2-type domain-containing protein n=1 Tax=Salix udensis TaxID=889485 RepID=A0AAD6NWQ4_9ROSI|nr:hypothetical protein OIU84_010960 [Salix udensis]